jgi:hypothetical protein
MPTARPQPLNPFIKVSDIGMTIFRDPYIILLLVLLMMTLGAFLFRLIPYPVGILVLIALIMMRMRSVRSKQRGSHRE